MGVVRACRLEKLRLWVKSDDFEKLSNVDGNFVSLGGGIHSGPRGAASLLSAFCGFLGAWFAKMSKLRKILSL